MALCQDPLLLKFMAMSAEHDQLFDVAAEYFLQHPQAGNGRGDCDGLTLKDDGLKSREGPDMHIPLLAARHGYPERAAQFLSEGNMPAAVLASASAFKRPRSARGVATLAMDAAIQTALGTFRRQLQQSLELEVSSLERRIKQEPAELQSPVALGMPS
eukprot:Skav212709  [mRNA]  locus=scaffold113:9398:14685:- [translate_table: standard]